MSHLDRVTVYQSRTVVDANRHVTVGALPFAAGEQVNVIVLPAVGREIPHGLLELFSRAAHPAGSYRWNEVTLPTRPALFEDLLFLFELSPLNRGLARLDVDEAAAAFQAIASLGSPHGLEIGRFNGGSTFLFAVAVGTSGSLDSIDVTPRDDAALLAALEWAGIRERVHLIVADSEEVTTAKTYDFVFIDGDHSYEAARKDHNRWGRQVRRGGLIIHHDMGHSRPFASQLTDLARLRSGILRVQRDELELVQETGSLTIFRRISAAWTNV